MSYIAITRVVTPTSQTALLNEMTFSTAAFAAKRSTSFRNGAANRATNSTTLAEAEREINLKPAPTLPRPVQLSNSI
jgi:hypothetical protein